MAFFFIKPRCHIIQHLICLKYMCFRTLILLSWQNLNLLTLKTLFHKTIWFDSIWTFGLFYASENPLLCSKPNYLLSLHNKSSTLETSFHKTIWFNSIWTFGLFYASENLRSSVSKPNYFPTFFSRRIWRVALWLHDINLHDQNCRSIHLVFEMARPSTIHTWLCRCSINCSRI